MISVEKPGSPLEILEHFGTKGMKWGVRKESSKSGGKGGRLKSIGKRLAKATDTAVFELGTQSSQTHQAITSNATDKLIKSLPRIKARHGEYGKLRNRVKRPFSKEAKAYRADVKKTYLKHLETTANSMTNVQGTRRYTLKERGKPNTSSYFWDLKTEAVTHADAGVISVQPIFDDEGWIVDFKIINNDIEQTMNQGINFLVHMGIEI